MTCLRSRVARKTAAALRHQSQLAGDDFHAAGAFAGITITITPPGPVAITFACPVAYSTRTAEEPSRLASSHRATGPVSHKVIFEMRRAA